MDADAVPHLTLLCIRYRTLHQPIILHHTISSVDNFVIIQQSVGADWSLRKALREGDKEKAVFWISYLFLTLSLSTTERDFMV